MNVDIGIKDDETRKSRKRSNKSPEQKLTCNDQTLNLFIMCISISEFFSLFFEAATLC